MSEDGLRIISREELNKLTSIRKGETKLGEVVHTISSLDDLSGHEARFVLLGIKEDIGIRANLGKGGATDCWDWAIRAFLNVQSNGYLKGENVLMLGALEFEQLLDEAKNLDTSNADDLNNLRDLTARIDQEVADIIEKIVKADKVPIVIGGGHNNAYGNISGTARALGQPLNVLNIDPHTDFRSMEGRHSGNGFRYAHEEGHLQKYIVYGLHEGYNSAAILHQFLNDQNLTFQSFESLLNQTSEERYQGFVNMLNWLEQGPMSLELDLDSITRFPVSALNPSGFSLNEVRSMVRATVGLKDVRYFHICEGSPGRAANAMEREMLGKSIAYLLTDFIKSTV